MSYQVLARKYRPQTFNEVVGQQSAIRTLSNAIATGRIAHAFLFVGPRGIGKTSTARILAKALNCTNGPSIDFDPNEEICKEIAEGRSLDVIEIDGASNNGVDHVRDLRDNVRYTPVKGQYKIYIIDEVHMLSTAAFNALLKTLEEPPAHVKFIFATTEVHKVPATILSRCQRFDLRRISDKDIAHHLGKIAGLEGVTIDPEALRLLAHLAEGGLRDAESSLDQLISFCGNTIKEEDVLQIFGLTSDKEIRLLAEALLEGREQDALKHARAFIQSDKDLTRLTQDILRHFRNMLLFQISPEIAKDEMDAADYDYFSSMTLKPSKATLLAYVEELSQVESKLRFALVKEVVFEIALLRLIAQREKVSLEAVIKTLSSGATIVSSPQTLEEAKTPPISAQTPTRVSTPEPAASPKFEQPPKEQYTVVPKIAPAPAPQVKEPVEESSKPAPRPIKTQTFDKASFANDPLIQAALKEFDAKIVEIRARN